MILYKYTNTISGTVYYGITKNMKQRHYSHRSHARKGVKTPFYDAIRKYGWESFNLSISKELIVEQAQAAEIILIALTKNYNLHKGGSLGFSMLSKSADEVLAWREKLSRARAGKQPALGMSHSEATKALCGKYGKLRWDLYGRYPADVTRYPFKEAKKLFEISKTHYYRLKRSLSNDQ